MKKNPAAAIPKTEFFKVWHRFRIAIDLLVLEKGYEALTAPNLCKLAQLPESTILTYFGSFDILLRMHEHTIMLDQFLKLRSGGENLE
ncbi:hypothetical protein ABDD95_20370 [Mucilaginibacter sp. PAMB04274]|uniref:hypothetical protein n=1 Tax=Mucilaginibacter sp. PAMB04274 TaxID=3138568 RepID=UPI0031F6EB56